MNIVPDVFDAFLNVLMALSDRVFPMVPAGGANTDMILAPP